ncbi:MAG: hypothetical protein JWR23_1317 [Mucilaginibacter sp.]|nr:hypothetical protein [Mucilaginibacter sp.]
MKIIVISNNPLQLFEKATLIKKALTVYLQCNFIKLIAYV